jgi:hypothetical protein
MMKKILLFTGVIIIGLVLIAGGVFLGQANAQEFQPGSMMGRFPGNFQAGYPNDCGALGGGMMSGQFGGMMGGIGNQYNGEPISIAEAETAVANYLEEKNDDNLLLGEIMIFDNHAYAQVLDGETGQGAFELLVDHEKANVFPEPGPNMMWNIEYGMMSGQFAGMMSGQYGGMMNGQYGGMMGGGMMGNWDIDPDGEIEVSAEEAVQLAQEYLDANLTGLTADDHAGIFPGYYTIHTERDGQINGMLSVNAFNGQVFDHHWHGAFIEMSAEDHAG